MCSPRVWLWCIQSFVHSVSVVNSYRQSALRYLVRLGDVYTVRCFVEWGVGNILLFSSFCRWKETSWEQRVLVWKTGVVWITELTRRLLIAPVIIVSLCKGVDRWQMFLWKWWHDICFLGSWPHELSASTGSEALRCWYYVYFNLKKTIKGIIS